jgi:hypothetical protein
MTLLIMRLTPHNPPLRKEGLRENFKRGLQENPPSPSLKGGGQEINLISALERLERCPSLK